MRRLLTPVRLATVFAVIRIGTVSLVRAEGTDAHRPVTGNAVAADLLIARPMGLIATVLGTALWIEGLPFTLSNGSTEQAAQRLIVESAEYPFTHPLRTGS